MAGLPGNFQYQAVGKFNSVVCAILIQGGYDDLRVLQCQVLVIQEHLNGDRNLLAGEFIYGVEYPERLGENEMRYPRALANISFGGTRLLRIITGNEPNEDVGVNREHADVEYAFEWPLLYPALVRPSGGHSGIAPDGDRLS
jgi:hypothetical protein